MAKHPNLNLKQDPNHPCALLQPELRSNARAVGLRALRALFGFVLGFRLRV